VWYRLACLQLDTAGHSWYIEPFQCNSRQSCIHSCCLETLINQIRIVKIVHDCLCYPTCAYRWCTKYQSDFRFCQYICLSGNIATVESFELVGSKFYGYEEYFKISRNSLIAFTMTNLFISYHHKSPFLRVKPTFGLQYSGGFKMICSTQRVGMQYAKFQLYHKQQILLSKGTIFIKKHNRFSK